MLGGKVKGKSTSQNSSKPKYRLKKVGDWNSGGGGGGGLNTQVSFSFFRTQLLLKTRHLPHI